jgi:hypothetical protein
MCACHLVSHAGVLHVCVVAVGSDWLIATLTLSWLSCWSVQFKLGRIDRDCWTCLESRLPFTRQRKLKIFRAAHVMCVASFLLMHFKVMWMYNRLATDVSPVWVVHCHMNLPLAICVCLCLCIMIFLECKMAVDMCWNKADGNCHWYSVSVFDAYGVVLLLRKSQMCGF